jgi:hypothetical protein
MIALSKKYQMKALVIILLMLCLTGISSAQCKENIAGKQIEKGMYIHATATPEGKWYAAQVLTVNGTAFTCRFLHSNSVYEFVDFKKAPDAPATRMQATVKSSKGGGFAAGTVFRVNVFMVDPEPCDFATMTKGKIYDVLATFVADNKTYLARMMPGKENYTIRFSHTDSEYTTDKNFKVLTVKGGGYKVGSKMNVVHARILEF